MTTRSTQARYNPVVLIGHSVEHRPIVATPVGDPRAHVRVLVVGDIHGNERAGERIVARLRRHPPAGARTWLLRTANPDGAAAGTRQNAHGVDLNRNFPWRWRHLGGVYYSGPRPASEPETRALRAFILRERPAVSIWFHQHLNFVILQPGADRALMRRYARIAHMRTGTYPQVPGGAPRWENHVLPTASAFAVELAAGPLPRWRVRANVRAVLSVAQRVTSGSDPDVMAPMSIGDSAATATFGSDPFVAPQRA
jgi:protein MpaA